MSDENFKSHVGDILGLPPHLQPFWDIVETYPKDNPALVLVHYNEKYDPYNRSHDPLKAIRGTILDMSTGAVVASSYGHTQSLRCFEPLVEEFTPDKPKGQIKVETDLAVYLNERSIAPEEPARLTVGSRYFDSDRTQIFLGYEGVVLRIFKWRGKVFVSTHRRIDASQSHWGDREPFIEIYRRLGGPDPESLFGEEEYSPYCHLFLVVDNQIRLASSTRDNRVVYLGVKKVWSEEVHSRLSVAKGQPLESSHVGEYSHFDDISVHYPLIGGGNEPSAFSPVLDRPLLDEPNVSVDIANKFMFPTQFAANVPQTAEVQAYDPQNNELIVQYSADGKSVEEIYFPRDVQEAVDDRLRGGDFVVLYYREDNGETTVYRLEPETFQYRAKIMNDNPNLYNQFVLKMAEFVSATPQDLSDEYPRYNGADNKPLRLDEIEGRQVYWWSIFHDAAAPYYKTETDGFFDRYQRDIENLAEFIISEFPKISDPDELRCINENTQKRFTNLRSIATESSRTQRRSPHGILRNLLQKETGPSLYKMITTVKAIRKQKCKGASKKVEETPVPSVISS